MNKTIEINDWLNLDQADEDIGLFTNNNDDYNNNNNQQQFQFQSHLYTPDYNLNHHLISNNNNNNIISLDPSTILNYPTSSSTCQSHHSTTTTTPNTTTSNQFNNHSLQQSHTFNPSPIDHFPSYALDPALLSASIRIHPTANDHSTNNHNLNTATNSRSSSHTPQIIPQADHKPLSKNPELKITLPRRSPSTHPLFKKEEDEAQDYRAAVSPRNSHSRSSSAITFGQQPSSPPPPSHKRTLSHSHALVNVPEWEDKPSAEEYKMLSSKEKRQLRNKISARNFRHRRKQHISALEQQVAQRDQTIEALYNDLGAARTENKELKSQVEVLKQKWSDLMKKIEEMSLSSISPTSSTAPSSITTTTTTTTPGAPSTSANSLLPSSPRLRSAKTSTMIPLPNLHKDLGSHTRKPFNGVGGMTGGNVGVHTTLIPDVLVDVYKGPIRSHLDIPLSSPVDYLEELSPQALIEQKLERGLKEMVDLSGSDTSPMLPSKLLSAGRHQLPDNDLHKLHGDHGSVGTGEQNDSEVGAQLWRLLYEALRTDDGSPDAPMDPLKLRACLDGRLVLKLVEPAPPPYPLFVSGVDQLASRVAGCHI